MSASVEQWAVPAFNVSNLECVQAVVQAADRLGSPVVLQVSPGVIEYAGYRQITQIAFAGADSAKVPVVVHLDHARDPALVRRALADGYGSVMYDGSAFDFETNVRITSELAQSAHHRGAALEGELGVIPGSETNGLDQLRKAITTAEEARAFVVATGVDVLAPALGSVHRMPDDSVTVDEAAVAAIAAVCGCPLALHGGSGVKQSQLARLIQLGISKVNISSRVGRAFAGGLQRHWSQTPDDRDIRRFLGAGRDAVRSVAEEYMALCSSSGRVVGVGSSPILPLTEAE
jgi:fructose-bisphosphate aldolase class II